MTQSKLQLTIEQPQLAVIVEQFQPEVTVDQPAPIIQIEQPEPDMAVVQPEPKVTAEAAEPVVTMQQAEPNVAVDDAKPDVQVSQCEPEVSASAQQPDVTVSEMSVEQGQPQVQMNQAAPQVNVDQGQAQVDVNQPRAQVETQMGQAQVALNAEQGATMSASREEGVAVDVSMSVSTIEIPDAVAEAELLALEETGFAFHSDASPEAAMKNIRGAANLIDDAAMALLVGCASPVGNEDCNLAPSRRRVEQVRQALPDMGVADEQVVIDAAEGRVDRDGDVRRSEENRRVEIRNVPETAIQQA